MAANNNEYQCRNNRRVAEQVCLRAAHALESRRTYQAKPGRFTTRAQIGAIHEFQFHE
jgi:hypothetical protein